MNKKLFSVLILAPTILLAACGGPSGAVEGTWQMTVNSMGVEMPGTIQVVINADEVKTGSTVTKVKKWEKDGNKVTAVYENGIGEIFTVVDKDNLAMQQGPVNIKLTRVKN